MRRWFWALLGLSAVALTLAFAVFPIGEGRNDTRSYAHVFTATPGVPQPHLEIDMDPTNGSGPCNPVDTVRSVTTAQGDYQVAVCLTSSQTDGVNAEPNCLTFDLVYDDSLNQCVSKTPTCSSTDGACLDSNPDANAGVTVFSSPSLGTDWECSGVGQAPPVCDSNTGNPGPGLGRAYLGCYSITLGTLPVGAAVSAPIAEVTFHAIGGGVDNLSLDTVDVCNLDGIAIVGCPPGLTGPGTCFGGTDYKALVPTYTPTPTETYAPTDTPAPTPTATATPEPRLEIDMDPTNGGGPCNPVDTAVIHNVYGGNYQVAVCLTGAGTGNEPNSFSFELTYNDTLNQCVPTACTDACRDGNPDANTGTSVFSTPSLGNVGYDCSGISLAPPVCDKDTQTGAGHGRAYMGCFTTGSPTLPTGDEVSAPIAEVTFRAIAGGVDSLTLDNVSVASVNFGGDLVDCPGGPGECFGGTDYKTFGPTVTPTSTMHPPITFTPTPTPTATACPGDSDCDGVPDNVDNCPNVINPDQLNTDAKPIDNGPGVAGDDLTVPYSDILGDVCDPDIDNDYMLNTGTNQTLNIPGEDAGCGSGATNPILMDTDGDTVIDGAECLLSSDPNNRLSKPSLTPPNDSDGDGIPDSIETRLGSDPHNKDTDGDGIPDSLEVKGWGTSPALKDTNFNSCDDNIEIADVDGNYRVNTSDLLWVAYAVGGQFAYNADLDVTKDGRINTADLLLVAYQLTKSCR
jgi:hypothetical protein